MPYIRRDLNGQIESLHRDDDQGLEFLPNEHPGVTAFVGQGDTAPAQFGQLDADFVRVIEDVIDTLIVKNILNVTDLPVEAQAKLFARKSFRERVSASSLRLFSDSETGSLIGGVGYGAKK